MEIRFDCRLEQRIENVHRVLTSKASFQSSWKEFLRHKFHSHETSKYLTLEAQKLKKKWS